MAAWISQGGSEALPGGTEGKEPKILDPCYNEGVKDKKDGCA
tara:strand:- start:139 stop:264 length:126 start_codon:yes stop_codon:yes gene_type:complete